MAVYTDTSTRDLPTWMRRSLRPTDWTAILAMAFSLLVASPLFFMPGLPRPNDNEHWVFQTATYARAFSEGRLYPRWFPDALGGYGAPIPHYYPPAPAYSAAVLQTMFTNQPLDAVRLIYAGALALSSLPLYALVARHRGAAAGLIASLLYSTCPYITFTVPLLMGDLPAAISHLLLPLLLWAFDRLLSTNQTLDLPLTTLAAAGLLLTDIRYAALGGIFAVVLFGYHASSKRRLPVLTTVACAALGIMVAAFFWVPALIEQGEVRWRAVTDPLPVRITLPTLFATLTQLDPAESVPAPQYRLGTAIGLLTAITGLAFLARRRVRFDVFWWTTGIVVAAGAVLFQQSWLLGGAALALSLCASASLVWVERLTLRLQTVALSLLSGFILLTTLPMWLTPRMLDGAFDTSGTAQLQYELQGFGMAGLPAGWRLPATVPQDVRYDAALLASYTTGEIEKVDPQTIPAGVQVGFLDHDSHSDRLQIQSDVENSITLLTAAFPGWAADSTVDPVTLREIPDTGLMQISFSAGINSVITIALGSTPPRALGWAVSILALLALIILTRRRRGYAADYLADYPLIPQRQVIALYSVLAAAMLVALLAVTGTFPGLRAIPGGGLVNSVPLRISTDSGIEVVAYRQSRSTESVQLTIYWRALRALDTNLLLQVTLIDPTTGESWSQSPIRHPGNYPTRRWSPARYTSDHYWLELPPAAQTQPVAARVEVYDCTTICTPDDRVAFFDPQGVPMGGQLTLPVGS